jgi:hypothetical protein
MLDVAPAFPRPMADVGPRHTAALRGRLAHRGKAAHRTRVQPQRLGHNRPKAIDALPQLVGRGVLQTRRPELCPRFARLPQAGHRGQTVGDGQHWGGLRPQALERLQGQRVPPLGPEAPARIPPDAGVQPAHVCGLLAYQVRAFAHYLPPGSLSFGVDGPLGQHVQSSPMGQPASVGTVSGIFETVVLLHRCGGGERHPGACFHHPIDEPVPVVGGRHHPTLEICLIRASWFHDRGQMIGEASWIDHLGLLIE